FADVYRDARDVAAALIGRGLPAGARAAILADGSPEWVIGEFGVVLAGLISVPLSIKLLQEEVPFRINHCEAAALLVSKNQLRKVLSIYRELTSSPVLVYLEEDVDWARTEATNVGLPADRVVGFGELTEEGRRRGADLEGELTARMAAIGEDSVVTISYTSGTTGNPKGIMLTHLNYFVNVQDSVKVFDVPKAAYSTLLVIPCDHSFGHTVGIYAALARGITIYFVDGRGGGMAILRNIPGNLREASPVFLLTVPALTGNFMKKIIQGVEEQGPLVSRLFHAGIRAGITFWGDCFHRPGLLTRARALIPYRLADLLIFRKVRATFGSRIQFCVGGGALLDTGQQQFFRALGVPIFQGYGLTEAAPVISSNTQTGHKIGTSGQVLPSVICKIVREDGSTADPGEKGEICIRGENVMKGYYCNPEATAETIVEGWLHTGDLGYFDPDGFLVVTGREKALLISCDGEKYSPEGIEEAIVSASTIISQVMIYNDHCKYTSALLTVDPARLTAAATERGASTPDQLIDLVREELYRFRSDPAAHQHFPSQWIPSVFLVLPEHFSEENRMINSSMKLVRYKVLETHREEIDYLYSPEGGEVHNDRNRGTLAALAGVPAG
ncbi:AMP-dependent synthetase/ligase, partial [Salinispira pacifica]